MVPPSVVAAGRRWRAKSCRSQGGAATWRTASPPRPLLLAALLLLAAVAAALLPRADALQLVVPFASRKCISEDLPPATHVRGDLRVAAGDGDMTLDLFVTDVRGVVVYHASNVISSAFTFVTSPASSHSPRTALAPYRFCFHHQAHPHEGHRPGVERRVAVAITQERTEPRVAGVATSAHVTAVETRMQEVEQLVDGLVTGLDAASEAAKDVEAIQARVRRWVSATAVLGCVVILGAGAVQVWYLRRMFRKKRLM